MSKPPPRPPRKRENETDADAAFRAFVRRVWRDDVRPLLRGRSAAARARSAQLGGQVAAAGGALLDRALGLRGRPFTRALTVMGSSLGAMLPDAWDWEWIRRRATAGQRQSVASAVRRRAAALSDAQALALFGLKPSATREAFRAAWRAACLRWHPDKAADGSQRREYEVRFAVLQAARRRVEAAYADGRLPSS